MQESYRNRQMHHILACIEECEKLHTQQEVEAAIERAEAYARQVEGRREPVQQALTLAA